MFFLERHLTNEELNEFKKEVKIKLLEKDLRIQDLAAKTGYEERTLQNSFQPTGVPSKFMISAVSECLGIDISKYRAVHKINQGEL